LGESAIGAQSFLKMSSAKAISNATLNLTFLGGGKIAQAMIQGLKHQQEIISQVQPQRHYPKVMISAVDPNEKRITELRSKGYVAEKHLDESLANDTDVLILAVKPQQANEALHSLSKHPLKSSALVLSVVAGLPLKKISDARPGTSSLVRAMPNTRKKIDRSYLLWQKLT
jgi:pyrroline-5-carboxylate reductase